MVNIILNNIVNALKQPRFYILVFFTFVYCMLSLVNHHNYHTTTFDLGIYNNSIYQYGHFQNNHHPLGHVSLTNFLGDHFALYTIILSPLHYLFGTYTLLYVQIAAILFGGVGIYKLIKSWHPFTFLPEIALFHFFSFYGIFTALAFDYHDNVIATMIVPWFIYYVHINKLKLALFMALLIIIGKENMPLFLFCICLGLMVLYKNDKKRRLFALLIGLSSVIYALIVIGLIMPMFVKSGQSASHFQYSVLGSNGKEIIQSLVYNTKHVVSALFCNVSDNTINDGIKLETYICLLLSGGLCLLVRIEYGLMLLSIIAQKVFNDDAVKWGICCQYSVEFAPILVIAFYATVSYFKSNKLKVIISLLFCLLTFFVTINKMFTRKSYWFNEEKENLFSKRHYQSNFNKVDVDKISALIPSNAKLSCTDCFGPHLAFRNYIYLYPDVIDADYILVSQYPTPYLVKDEVLEKEIIKYKNSINWKLIAEINGIYLFKKTSNNN